jgi:hypothetical protein
MQKYIYLVTKQDGTKTAHSAVQSFLEHPSGVSLSKQHWSSLAKKGYPVNYKGVLVERVELFNTTESRLVDFESRCL